MTGVPLWSKARVPRVPAPGEGGLVDANSYLGEWPSRRLNGSPHPERSALVTQRLAHMDRRGIRKAAVSLLEGVWLKDASVANAELHTLLEGHGERFVPVYTINPTFPTWQEHLDRCGAEYGLAPGSGAIRLFPAAQGYALDAPQVAIALERLSSMNLPVVLPVQLEDARMQHPAMRIPDLAPAAVAGLVNAWPGLRVIVVAATSGQISAIGKLLSSEAHVWFDISRVQGPVDGIRTLCRNVGARRLLFGTNLPLHIPESPIMELADSRLTPADDAAVRYGNARAALGIV